jgi:nicotinate phosphoribosyltransferase
MTMAIDRPPPEEADANPLESHVALTRDALAARGLDPEVVAEIRAPQLPGGRPWAVLAGLRDALAQLEGRDVEAVALPEGSVFHPEEHVLAIAGRYLGFSDLETSLLGRLAHGSGIATAAARMKRAAEGLPVYLLDVRSVHPDAVAATELAAYLGGLDGLTTAKGADAAGVSPALVSGGELSLLIGEPQAWQAFDGQLGPDAPRVVTVGVLGDERSTAVAAAEALGDRLAAVRVEVPAARRGEANRIVRETRWELDVRGWSSVRVIVSGDLGESEVRDLARDVDGFGVGSAVALAPHVPFSLDLVEVDGRPVSARGKLSGPKHLWRCENCGNRGIAPSRARLERCTRCGGRLQELLQMVMKGGRREAVPPAPAGVRARALREAAAMPDSRL